MVSTRSELAGGYDSECGVGGGWPATSERPEKELALRQERAWCVPETGRCPMAAAQRCWGSGRRLQRRQELGHAAFISHSKDPVFILKTMGNS